MGAVLFVREDLLKASHYQLKTIHGHVHKGTWVADYQKNVLVGDDHNDLNVAGGHGSFYQKQAHKKLSAELDHFHTMPVDHKVAVILAHATDMQLAASASAAVSGFKASVLAGKVPTLAQYKAYSEASDDATKAVYDACTKKIGALDFAILLDQAAQKAGANKQGKQPLAHAPIATVATPSVAAESDERWVTLKDFPGTKYKLNADGKWEAHGNGISMGNVAIEGPELSAALFIKQGTPVPADVVAELSEKSKAAIVKDAAAEFGMSTMDVQELLTANEKPAGPKEGDTKPGADGSNLVFKNGRWHKYVNADESGELPPVLVPVADDADNHAAAVAAMESGAFYQKEAIKKLKAEHGPAWQALHPSKQHELAHAKYQALQGAASLAAAVSGWKKHMLAGQVPTPGEVKAFATMAAQDPVKGGKLLAEVQTAIGADKLAVLVSQAHAKAAKAPVVASVPAKVFVTTPPQNNPFGILDADISAAHAPVTMAETPAYDHLAQSITSKKGHSLPAQKTFHKLAAQDWMAANPSKGAEMYDALVAHKLSHLAAMVGGDVKPAAVPSASPIPVNTDKDKFKTNPDILSFITMFKMHGGKAAQNLTMEELLDPPEIAAFNKLTPEQKMDVAAAISFYGPHKLKLFMDWLSAQNSKAAAAAPAGPVPVTSNVYVNKTPGHNKFWSVSVHGNQMKTTYGKLGTQGSTTTKDFASPGAAVAAANKLKGEKVGKGYTYGYTGVHQYDGASAAPLQPNAPLQPAAPGAPAADKVAGVPPAVKAEFDKLAAQGDFSTLQAILDTGGLKLEVKGYLEKLIAEQQSGKIKHLSGGWKLDPSDGALSGEPSLTQESKDGYTYYIAHTGDSFQVGIIDPEGNPNEYEDYPTAEDAAAQMNLYIGGNNAGIPYPLFADILALDPNGGPKDGDTKLAVDGSTLVFKNGRWHKQGIVVPDFSDDTTAWGKHYTNAAKMLKDAFDSGGTAAVKKLVTIHTGSKAGKYSMVGVGGVKIKTLSPNDSAPRRVKMHAFIKAMLDANVKAGKKVVFTTAAPGAAVPKPAAAAPKPAQAAPHAKVFVTAPPGKPGVTVIDGWPQTGPQKGSNPGGKFKDKNGQEWYCKFPASEDHAKNELLASKLYKAAGIDVPTLRLVEKGGKIGIASKIVDGVTKVGVGIKNASGALEGFAVDAWLGNYDSVGTGYDNLLKTKDGKAIRIDVGGSLLYRAQGAPKGDSFGDDVTEIDAMRDPSKNQFGASVFSTITKEKLNESVALVLDVPDDVIQQIVSKFGPGTDAQKAALAAKLIARKKSLAKKYPAADLIVNPPKPDPHKLPIDPSKLPKKLDFLNWKGPGQGLSGTAKVNEANQAAADQIYAAAMKGDYVELKKLKFHIVDKATGAVKEGALFGDHPSQHIKDFYSTVLDYMEVVANPAAKKAKSWDIGDYSDINELSDGFKAHLYGVTVGAVPANQRLGFWISLGQAEAAQEFMPAKVDYITEAGKALGKQSNQGIPHNLKTWMQAVKSSGSANTPYRDGKEIDNQGQSTREVLVEAYKHAAELPEGTRITKNIDLPSAMMQQMLGLPSGHVFQNPGSMCCSINKNWSSFGGNARLKIIYAKGAKALYNIGVGSFNGEGEITTIPGQRFMLLEKDTSSHPTEFTLLMLPPDETYVANIKPKA